MTNKANPIEIAVADYLTEKGVTFKATGGTATIRDGWECDHWSVSFIRDGKPTIVTDYYTGVGHRESKRPMPMDIARLGSKILARVQWERENLKPVAPPAAGVLYSLLSDARFGESNFHDFCDELGYDADSIKHLNIYNACCETLKQMRSFFTNVERNELDELLQDY